MTAQKWDIKNIPIKVITRTEQLDELSAAVSSAEHVAVDTETHSATTFEDGLWSALRVISVATLKDGDVQAFVVDVRDINQVELGKCMSNTALAYGWNVNFDQRVLKLAGCDVQKWYDAMYADSMLHSGLPGFEFWHSLAHSSKKHLGLELDGKGTVQTSYDGVTDLSSEQIRYAAEDAIITLQLTLHLRDMVESQGLSIPVQLEQDARPFILDMMEHGLPFDYSAWDKEVISEHKKGQHESLLTLASLTGGGASTLFGESDMPSWNPDSDAPTRDALNTYAKDAVYKFTNGRPLTKVDKLDKTTLKQINHPIAKALLKYRDHSKILTTYGENLEKFIASDLRIHPRYKQGGVVATGRLASDNPNAQNFSPAMKKYIRVGGPLQESGKIRAFVYADLSQAELRVLAQVSHEEKMREMFRLGGDFHARTAADMFQVDMDKLKLEDPENYSNQRKKAKGVNFGIPYGLGAAALATNLTVNSKLNTTTAEAKAMLENYARAYPNVDKWLGARDKYVKDLAKNPGSVDWEKTFQLHEIWIKAEAKRKSFKRSNKRYPTPAELLEALEPESQIKDRLTNDLGRTATQADIDNEKQRLHQLIDWAFTFDRPILLKDDGTPITFESRTLTGRRRLFAVPTDSSPSDKFEGVITSAVLIICTSDKEKVAELRDEFAKTHNLDIPTGINRTKKKENEDDRGYKQRLSEARKRERVSVVKAFEGSNKYLKYELIKYIRDNMGEEAVTGYLLPMAVSDQIRSKGNQYRNHPIQSLVADIGLAYYADLHDKLKKYNDAFPVQAVHDSIAIECDLEEAEEICAVVQNSLETAMQKWCPDVPAKADADIRLSLSDDDVLSPEAIKKLLKK
ncbi:MAG: DNA polymerase [Candidatus Paceibacterota bacterium]